jgi:hypothetical protein
MIVIVTLCFFLLGLWFVRGNILKSYQGIIRNHTEDFATYIQQRGYDLHDSTYGKFASMFAIKFA